MMVNFRPVQTTQWDHVSNKTQRQSNVLKPVSVHRQRNRESEGGHVGQIPKSPPISISVLQPKRVTLSRRGQSRLPEPCRSTHCLSGSSPPLPFPDTTTLISMGDESECQEPAHTGLSQSLLPPSKKQHEHSWII